MSQYLAIVKRAYVPLVAADEECVPGNIAALEKGLEARAAARSRDFVRERELWAEAKALLGEESENDMGAGANGTVHMEDTFHMQEIGGEW